MNKDEKITNLSLEDYSVPERLELLAIASNLKKEGITEQERMAILFSIIISTNEQAQNFSQKCASKEVSDRKEFFEELFNNDKFFESLNENEKLKEFLNASELAILDYIDSFDLGMDFNFRYEGTGEDISILNPFKGINGKAEQPDKFFYRFEDEDKVEDFNKIRLPKVLKGFSVARAYIGTNKKGRILYRGDKQRKSDFKETHKISALIKNLYYVIARKEDKKLDTKQVYFNEIRKKSSEIRRFKRVFGSNLVDANLSQEDKSEKIYKIHSSVEKLSNFIYDNAVSAVDKNGLHNMATMNHFNEIFQKEYNADDYLKVKLVASLLATKYILAYVNFDEYTNEGASLAVQEKLDATIGKVCDSTGFNAGIFSPAHVIAKKIAQDFFKSNKEEFANIQSTYSNKKTNSTYESLNDAMFRTIYDPNEENIYIKQKILEDEKGNALTTDLVNNVANTKDNADAKKLIETPFEEEKIEEDVEEEIKESTIKKEEKDPWFSEQEIPTTKKDVEEIKTSERFRNLYKIYIKDAISSKIYANKDVERTKEENLNSTETESSDSKNNLTNVIDNSSFSQDYEISTEEFPRNGGEIEVDSENAIYASGESREEISEAIEEIYAKKGFISLEDFQKLLMEKLDGIINNRIQLNKDIATSFESRSKQEMADFVRGKVNSDLIFAHSNCSSGEVLKDKNSTNLEGNIFEDAYNHLYDEYQERIDNEYHREGVNNSGISKDTAAEVLRSLYYNAENRLKTAVANAIDVFGKELNKQKMNDGKARVNEFKVNFREIMKNVLADLANKAGNNEKLKRALESLSKPSVDIYKYDEEIEKNGQSIKSGIMVVCKSIKEDALKDFKENSDIEPTRADLEKNYKYTIETRLSNYIKNFCVQKEEDLGQ